MSTISLKNLLERITISQYSISKNKCLYEDFSENTKVIFDLGSKRIRLKDQAISRIASHTVRNTAETIQDEKMRKRKNREEKKELKDKEQAKKAAQTILDRINKIDKKVERLMELEKQFKQISNHIIYLHETSPRNSKLYVQNTNQKHVRRKSL